MHICMDVLDVQNVCTSTHMYVWAPRYTYSVYIYVLYTYICHVYVYMSSYVYVDRLEYPINKRPPHHRAGPAARFRKTGVLGF